MKNEKKFLTETEKRAIEALLKKELYNRKEIIFAYLHGSFLHPVPCGDIDIAVYVDEQALPAKYWEYEAGLAIDLERQAGMPVDVLVLNKAPIALRYHVTRGEVLLSRDESTRFDFVERTWREYFDYQPVLRAYLNDLLG